MNNLTRYGGGLPREVRQELIAADHGALLAARRIQNTVTVGTLGMSAVSTLSATEASLMRACPRGAARIEETCEAVCRAVTAEIIRYALQ